MSDTKLLQTKCNFCFKAGWLRRHQTSKWFWVRCARCGAHTSSYLSEADAIQAAQLGEHYVSENGNLCFSSLADNPFFEKRT